MTIDLLNVQMKTVMRYISNKDGCNNPRDGFCTVMQILKEQQLVKKAFTVFVQLRVLFNAMFLFMFTFPHDYNLCRIGDKFLHISKNYPLIKNNSPPEYEQKNRGGLKYTKYDKKEH